MANGKKGFNKSKPEKGNEFYAKLSDIENELLRYEEHFKDKTVLCNCGDPRVSNLFRNLAQNVNDPGLKELITSGYNN